MTGQAPGRSYSPIDLTIRNGETTMDYSLSVEVNAYQMATRAYFEGAHESKGVWQAYASFSSAAYREAEILLDGKKHRLVVLDHNSNGSFNDLSKPFDDPEFRKRNSQFYINSGDMLLVDPDPKAPTLGYGFDVKDRVERQFVSKLACIGGRYWNIEIAPAGDKVTLSPCTLSVGHLTNPLERFNAVIYGELGFLSIHADRGKPAVVPQGQWQLVNYTIDGTEAKPAVTTQPTSVQAGSPAAPDTPKRPRKSLFSALVSAFSDDQPTREDEHPSPTIVSAQARWDYKAVTVTGGQTAALPFGPPYRASVNASYYRESEGIVQLEMALLGTAGEQCSDLMVKGERPASPTFAIARTNGEIVERGKFEFG